MAAGVEAGLDHRVAVFDKRTHHIGHDLRAAEKLGERRAAVLDLNDLAVRGLDAGNLVDDILHALLVASGGDEGDVVFA